MFGPTDDPKERQLKLGVIKVYNDRLDEMEKRKQFVVESNLLDSKGQPAAGSKRKVPKVKFLFLFFLLFSGGRVKVSM